MIWQIITGEYPPQDGGASTYTGIVAAGLAAAGDEVHVWTPQVAEPDSYVEGVTVHRLPGRFGVPALRRLDRALRDFRGSRWLVQYVPHAFGWRGMNLPFCLWLYARRSSERDVMFHEVMFPIARGQPLKHNLMGRVNRVMAWLAAGAAARLFVSTPIWEAVLRTQAGVSRPIIWLPLPGTIPVVRDEAAVLAVRNWYKRSDRVLVGHFSTYPKATQDTLGHLLPDILAADGFDILLMGKGSREFRDSLAARRPDLAGRLFSSEGLAAPELSCHLSACDLMLQIYPDGACTRRTTLVAALEHGRAIVAYAGPATEELWNQGAVALAHNQEELRDTVLRLVAEPATRERYQSAAAALYRDRFEPRYTIEQLRSVS
jgi:glycosyltransferase involved in cell wall biosynthesis